MVSIKKKCWFFLVCVCVVVGGGINWSDSASNWVVRYFSSEVMLLENGSITSQADFMRLLVISSVIAL